MSDALSHLPDHIISVRPWGQFEQFTENETTTVKLLSVSAGQRLSYQSHQQRSEFWRCLAGPVGVLLDDVEYTLAVGESIFIPVGAKHRLMGLKTDGLILEIAFGHFAEDDIERFADDYGRSGA
jgi:mannose-6-phosphate isomerase-like protein (cupin superfamily)